MKEDWLECTLGEVCDKITKGSTPTTYGYKYQKEGVNFIKIENVVSGKIELKSIYQFISEEAHNSQKRSQLKDGDILFSIAGTIGETCLISSRDLPANTNQAFAIISGFNQVLDANFLRKQLDSFVSRKVKSKARGGAMNNVSLTDLKEMELVVPSLIEQRAIVNKIEELFGSLDNGIADLKKAQEQLKIYRQAVLKKAFDLDDKKYKIEEICKEIFAGGDKPKDFYSEKKTSDLRVPIIANAFANNGIYGYTKYARVNENAITIAGRGSGTGNVELRTEPFLPIVRLITIIPNSEIVKIEFLMYFLKNLNLKGSGSAIPQLTIPMVKRYAIHLPSLKEQHQIVLEIERRLSVCDKVEESIKESLEKAEALRQSILKKAFEGKLLSAAEIAKCKQAKDYEPASVLFERIKKEKLKK